MTFSPATVKLAAVLRLVPISAIPLITAFSPYRTDDAFNLASLTSKIES